ncbi:unnamed protein product, partial [Closterium sp. Naga37s-1]
TRACSLVTATEPPSARLTRCARCAHSRASLSSSLRTSSEPPSSSVHSPGVDGANPMSLRVRNLYYFMAAPTLCFQ